ncbi:MAG: hypothetical protein ABI175_27785 [Polyangiales bacterium]
MTTVVRVLAVPLLVVSAFATGCPARRDDASGGGTSQTSTGTIASAQRPITGSTATPLPSDLSGLAEAPLLATLPAGVALPPDVAASEPDSWGIELEWSVRLRFAAGPAIERQPWTTLLSGGRITMKLGAPVFVDDRSELRASVGWVGALHVWGSQASAHYRVLPPGSLRAFLNEGRADVVPLAPARVVGGEPGDRLGRKTERVTITTAYGTLELEQIVAPASVRPPLAGDARPPGDAGQTSLSLEGAGDPLCRLLLELVAADRVASGEPCRVDRVPVLADVAYATGGGLTFEATSLHERMVPRWEITFPPAGAPLSPTLSPVPAAHLLVTADALLALRARGEVAQLVLQNDAASPRVAVVDGLAVATIPPGQNAVLDVRAGTYLLEWRTPIGELVERAIEVAAPGRAAAAQLSPVWPAIAAAIPSARIGP